jgi:hypothetical protein
MNVKICPHPSPLPEGEGTRLLAPFSPRRRVGDEGKSSLYSAMPEFLQVQEFLADLEDLQDLRQAKNDEKDSPTISLAEAKIRLNPS